MSQLPKAQIDQLKAFVTVLQAKPAILHDPGLQFFRDYLVSLGAKLPSPPPELTVRTEQIPVGRDISGEDYRLSPALCFPSYQSTEPLSGEQPV